MLSQKERDGTLFLIGRYRQMLSHLGHPPVQADDRLGAGHAHWMLIELQKHILSDNPKYDDGKVGRWLGYIQCTLALMSIVNSEEEADISRPFFGR